MQSISENGLSLDSVALTSELISDQDCIVITTDHAEVDYQALFDSGTLIFDTRNATKGIVPSGLRTLGVVSAIADAVSGGWQTYM